MEHTRSGRRLDHRPSNGKCIASRDHDPGSLQLPRRRAAAELLPAEAEIARSIERRTATRNAILDSARLEPSRAEFADLSVE